MLVDITLKNFLCFKEINFNFAGGYDKAKHLVAMYGENGAGKSCFVESINFLKHITANRFAEYRTIGCLDPAEVSYSFDLNGCTGTYTLRFDDSVLFEKLVYKVGSKTLPYFEVTNSNDSLVIKLSPTVFATKGSRKKVKDSIRKYWGKTTVLSILETIGEKNKENYSPDLFNVIGYFRNIKVVYGNKEVQGAGIYSSQGVQCVLNFEKGVLASDDIPVLNATETLLQSFLPSCNPDIKKAYYERTETSDGIEYQLYVVKQLEGELIHIPFSRESAGIKKLIRALHLLLLASCGETVVFDKLDNGIHDLLAIRLIESIKDQIKGQLIFTTHNTSLLDSLSPKDIYLISSDYAGHKEVNCLTDYQRIQKNNSIRNLYCKGAFGGIPDTGGFDFDYYTSIMSKQDAESGEEL